MSISKVATSILVLLFWCFFISSLAILGFLFQAAAARANPWYSVTCNGTDACLSAGIVFQTDPRQCRIRELGELSGVIEYSQIPLQPTNVSV